MKKNSSLNLFIKILVIVIIICLGILLYKDINKNLIVDEEHDRNNKEYQYEKENNNKDTDDGNIAVRYYYNQLNENAKLLYEGIYKNKENLRTGNYIIEYDDAFNNLLNQENGNEILKNDFQSAWNAFSYDNMDVFYIDISKFKLLTEGRKKWGKVHYKVSIGLPDETYLNNDEKVLNNNYFKEYFKSAEQVEKEIETIEEIRSNVVKQAKQYKTDYERIKFVHDYLISNIEYEDKNIGDSNNYTIFGTLKMKRAVCEGYSRTLKYILDELKIPCLLVPGIGINEKKEEENHAWNYVFLENKWYAIDLTWDDPIIIGDGYVDSSVYYKFFLNGSEDFFVKHRESNKLIEGSQEFIYPRLSRTNYF